MVAPDTIEQERLFNMGMKMGQDFIQFAKLNQTEEDKKIMNKEVPLVWALSWPGPSTDFILGRVYQQIFDGLVNRQRSEIPNADKEKAQRWGHWLYQDSNCAMLR